MKNLKSINSLHPVHDAVLGKVRDDAEVGDDDDQNPVKPQDPGGSAKNAGFSAGVPGGGL